MTASPILDEPYPGLRSFRRDETHIFFGRETCISDMVQRLGAHRFLAVTGTSGSGKSSLVRTGLLDALDRGLLAAAGADWRFADFRPGSNPLTELAAALLNAVGAPASEQDRVRVEAMLARGPLGLLEWLESTELSPDTSLLVLADQFEEIFRFRRGRSGDDINAFVALLLASAAQRKRPIYVVITMRSDFLGECAQFTGLAETINDGQYLTPRLTREQCQSAIEGPAAVFGGRVESALTNRLLNDMGTNADQLPLAQHALMRLWRIASARTGPDAGVLKLEDYEKLGGIGSSPGAEGGAPSGHVNALSAHADEILGELNAEQRRLAAILFRGLTEGHGTGGRDVRRPIALGEAAAIAGVTPDELAPVIDAFRAPGRNLLTPPINIALTAETVVDISHESLIRQWGTLREWLREEADAARIYLHVEANAKLWREGNSALMTMPYLGIARAWREREQPNAAWAKRYGDDFDLAMAFLDQSLAAELQRIEAEEAARRRSTRRTRAVAIAMTVLAVIAGGFAYFGYEAADKARKSAEEAGRAEALAKQMSDQATKDRDNAQRGQSNYLAELARQRFAQGDLLHSLLFSIEALPDLSRDVMRPEVREAREMLMQSYLQLATQTSPVAHVIAINVLRFLPSGDRLLSASDDGTARIWDLNGQPIFVMGSDVGPVTGADATPDGKLIATASADGIARIWDAGTGHQLAQLPGTSRLNGIAFRKDGKAVVTFGADSIARIWDLETDREIGELKGHAPEIKLAKFSPDGARVLTVAGETAQVWDAHTHKLLKEIKINESEEIVQAGYTADGSRIVLTGKYTVVDVWDANALKSLGSFTRPCCLRSTAVSADGSVIAFSGFSDVTVFNLRTREQIWSINIGEATDMVFSPDGSRLIAATDFGDIFQILDARTGGRIATWNANTRLHPVALSPDGKRLAAFSARGNLIFWNLSEKSPGSNAGNGGALIPSGDGRRFLFAQDGGSTAVWDASAKKMLGTLLASRGAPVGAFDPKAQWIAALSADSVIGIWAAGDLHHAADIANYAASRLAFDPAGHVLLAATAAIQFDVFDDKAGVSNSAATEGLASVKAVALSRDGRELFLAGPGSIGQVWDVDKGRIVATIVEPGIFSQNATFSPDGTRLVTQAEDGTLRLLDARTGALVTVLQTDSAGFRINPAGDRLVTTSQSRDVRIWDLSTGKLLLLQPNAGDSLLTSARSDMAIAWSSQQLEVLDTRLARQIGTIKLESGSYMHISADGGRIVIEHGATVAIWDAQTLHQIAALAGTWNNVGSIEVSPNPDASRIVVKDDKGALELFDGATGAKMATLDDQFQDGLVVYAPDGSRSVLARQDGRLDLWDIVAGKHLATLNPGGAGYRLGVAFSNDSSIAVTATGGPMARVWNARTGEHIVDLSGQTAEVGTVSVSPDSRRVVTLSKDGVIVVWDAHTGAKVGAFTAPRNNRSILFAAEGARIVSVGGQPQTDIFETGAWKVTATVAGRASGSTAAFSPDGQNLVTAVGTNAKVWQIATGRELATLQGHTATINDAVFSPDGGLILTVSDDKTGRIWDAKTGAPQAQLKGDTGPIAKGRFSLDGKYVVTISTAGEAKLWRAADGSLISTLGPGKNYNEIVFDRSETTVALFSKNEMTEYELDSQQAGGQVTTSITLVEGTQSGINYVTGPFANLVANTDRSIMVSGLAMWLMPWSTQGYVEQAQKMLPRCLTPDERRKAYLDPEPPAWCIAMEKWPYNTPVWKQWLTDKAAGKEPPLPQDH